MPRAKPTTYGVVGVKVWVYKVTTSARKNPSKLPVKTAAVVVVTARASPVLVARMVAAATT